MRETINYLISGHMSLDVLLGLQWGDEGKGKIVDVLTPGYQVVARFQGGPNAGHTLEFNGQKHILHLIPSGIFHPETLNIIGNGVVLDPLVFRTEVNKLAAAGVDARASLVISRKTHLILPTHCALDAAQESSKGDLKIGSTLRGIGPAYTDKISRQGLRVGEIHLPDFKARYSRLVKLHEDQLAFFGYEGDLKAKQDEWFDAIEFLKSFRLADSEYLVDELLAEGKSFLAEGAQGSLLDIDFGSYPFVTSSNTVCAGACTGLGVAPSRINKVFGIFKAYCTRVGSGPFPTELENYTGHQLRDQGHEYGSTTGRPRRCGWLDLVALKYTVMLNGVTELIMTKADVFTGIETLKVATSYIIDGKECKHFPFDASVEISPVYTEMPGWVKDISSIRTPEEMPEELLSYISFIEKEIGVPVRWVSVGPDREATIQIP